MTREDLEEMALMGLAAGAGAVDEVSFGLAEKYVPGVKKLREENPNSFMAGQVGSLFIPGLGVIGMGSKALRLARGGKNVVRAAKAAQGPLGNILAKMALKAVKSGATGAVEAGGQTAIRNTLGTSGGGDVLGNAKMGGAGGMVIGGASPLLGGLARKVYSHPKIFDPRNPKSPELIDRLVNEGVWGGESTFRRYADKAKGKYNEILDPMRKGVAKKKVSIDDVVGAGSDDADSFAERQWNKKTTGQKAAAGQFEETLQGAKSRLGDTPKMGDVNDYLSVINKELAGLKPQKRLEAITGVGGTASNSDEALGALKASIERLERGQIGKKYGKAGVDKIKQAKERWGTGRNLERALDRPESLSQVMKNVLPTPAVAGTLGGVAAGTVGLPSLLVGAGVGAGAAAAKSLPGRTGMGVAIDRLGKNPRGASAQVGRAVEYANREEPEGENPFIKDLGESPKRNAAPKTSKETSKEKSKEEKKKNKLIRDEEENIFLEGLDL